MAVNFAFALISEDFTLKEMAANDSSLWIRTTALKERNPTLKVFLSIGGWNFNDPPTQHIFSNLAGSLSATNTFIKSTLGVLQAYGFDGIDIDWEYPVAPERGGAPEDKDNFPIFLSRIKSAFSPRGYGLTFTAPSSYWYLQHFDLPALLKSADWVNIMTYDLHGVWDKNDTNVGPFVLAHTNLTEIMDTMQLFRNVQIDPSQMVMGIGFYGRSFTLVDGQCSSPGCAFSGGGDPGECSLNSGTLMFSEIQKLLDSTSNAIPVFDEAAAVKYITWNDNQWVSYDDAQTLQMKLNYANSICLGGTMIWSLDQDDNLYTALTGLYPDIGINTPSSIESGNQCRVTAKYPPEDHVRRTSSHAFAVLKETNLRNVRGEEEGGQVVMDDAMLGKSSSLWIKLEMMDIQHAFRVLKHSAAHRGTHKLERVLPDTCDPPFIAQTHVNLGPIDIDGCADTPPGQGPFALCPVECLEPTKPVCCKPGYKNCKWVGDPPACLNAVCSPGQIAIFSDIQGDASSQCFGNNKRYYCCDPPSGSSFVPIPVSDVFPSTVDADEPVTFTVDFDDNTGTSSTSSTGAGSSGIGDDGRENDSPFGELFISSPNPSAVSSMDIASDWVVTGCDSTSDQPQTVLAYCSKSMDDDDSGCGHVFIGQAEHTIIQMPKSCGLGPYARVVSLTEHTDQNSLSQEHQAKKPTNEMVYSLSFDYNFLAIPEDNGPVLMRADVTDIPGYWHVICLTPPDSGTTSTRRRRDFHQPLEYDKRWFGPFDAWLKKLNTVRSSKTVSRDYHWSDTYTIFHAEQQCPNFSSSLDISVTGTAQITSQFGYYLEATIVPPAVQQAYVFFDAGAGAQASFTISGLAEAHYTSGRRELATFGFPGLYYPGLLTLGPSLHLYGELTGQLSLSGRYTATIGYTFPPINYAFGLADDNPDEASSIDEDPSSPVNSTSDNVGYDFAVGYNVNLEGSLQAHIIPSLQLGVNVLGGSLIDAEVFAEADMYAGVSISGSVSQSSALTFCVNPHYGINLNAGLTGSVLFWRADPVVKNFFSADFPFGGSCFDSVNEGTGSGNSRRSINESSYTYEARGSGQLGSSVLMTHDQDIPAYAVINKRSPTSQKRSMNDLEAVTIQKPLTSWTVGSADASAIEHDPSLKRRAIPFLPGFLTCPTVGDEIAGVGGATDCYCYSDNNIDDQGATGQYADIQARWIEDITANYSSTYTKDDQTMDDQTDQILRRASGTATMTTCPAYSLDMSGYSGTDIVTYFDVKPAEQLKPTLGTYTPYPPNILNAAGIPVLTTDESGGAIYGREHIYEVSMASLFIDHLQQFTDLWQIKKGPSWCQWVNQNLRSGSNSVFEQIQNCYPGGSNGADEMVMLEQQANVFKNYAYFATERLLVPGNRNVIQLVDDDKWDKMCPTKQVARLRAAAGLPSYLNSFDAKRLFKKDNTCIRNIWVSWYNSYVQLSPLRGPNPGNVNVPNIYDNFIYNILNGVVPYLKSQITHYIQNFNPNGGDADTVEVRLSLPVELDYWTDFLNGNKAAPWDNNLAPKADVKVSRTQLTQSILNAMPSITWLNTLPTH
uniref:GH18 domain-containing protein n=1 Tax=Psilocybe cubensis TaxID=181762 RepID=A0A8H7XM16_PSICU